MIRMKTPAKINLFLKVHEKRTDGYHEMETVMLKVGFFDELDLAIESGDQVSLTIENQTELSTTNNLVVKAVRDYLEFVGLKRSVKAHLSKQIYISAGLGGGSSDAACALLLMNKKIGALSFEELLALGAKLGSDVPFFLHETSLGYAWGRGEKVIPWQALPSRRVVLAKPEFGLSTKLIYQKLGRPLVYQGNSTANRCSNLMPETWTDFENALPYENDLEAIVENECPQISAIKAALLKEGASVAMMTGSGSTVFGMFDDETLAIAATSAINLQGFRAVFVKSL
ncbi:MAG: 4-(cytidine 5'-diphospho)-2-C-methyl-D-erythritol kinase [Bdellovibrionales bacterium]|nr:4-(cytidine 5'-diphospho)-2-C-methyl-D-erythritol kinase [Bdellovibrionales bacterium]